MVKARRLSSMALCSSSASLLVNRLRELLWATATRANRNTHTHTNVMCYYFTCHSLLAFNICNILECFEPSVSGGRGEWSDKWSVTAPGDTSPNSNRETSLLMRSLNVVLSWVIKWSMIALQLQKWGKLWNNFYKHSFVIFGNRCKTKHSEAFTLKSLSYVDEVSLFIILSPFNCDLLSAFLSCNNLHYSCTSLHPHTVSFLSFLLTGWRRRSPSGRRCGPWRGRRPPSSRHAGCTDTHLDCSTVGYKPGSWGRCERCQRKIRNDQDVKHPCRHSMCFIIDYHY